MIELDVINRTIEQSTLGNDSISPLHYAVLNGDTKRVKRLIVEGVDIMELDTNDETALMIACQADSIDFEMVSLLVEYGSDIMYEREVGINSAFIICIRNSRDSLMQFLINRLTLNQREFLKSNNFHLTLSITASELRIVEQLIFFQKDLNAYDFAGRSFLEHAIDRAIILDGLRSSTSNHEKKEKLNFKFNAAVEIIDLLLSNGADINEISKFSSNVNEALYSPVVLSFLVSKGLNLNEPVEKYVATNDLRMFKILDLLISKISKGEILHLQGEDVDITKVEKVEGYLDVLDLMIEKGAKSSQQDVAPYDQLAMKAVESNNIKLLKILLVRKKVNVNFIGIEGKTLLMRAQEMKSQEMIELLVKNGAS